MKKSTNKIILLFLILVAVLAGYYIYKSYSAYKSYQVIQKSEKYMLYIENLNEVLQNIEQERSFSAVYLGYKGKVEFSKLNTLREDTDKMIINLEEFIQNNPTFSTYRQKLTKLSHNLQYARSRVDVISPDYSSIFFDYYQNEISTSLLNEIGDSIKELSLSTEGLKKYITSYIQFVKFRNNINMEKSFISFILSNSKKMDKQDLLFWNNMLNDNTIARYDNLDKKTITNIDNILQPNNFLKLSFTTRADVAKGITDGNYPISLTNWIQSEDENIKRVKLTEDILYSYITKIMNNIILSPKNIIFNLSIVSFLVFLFLLLLFLGRNKKVSKNKKNIKTPYIEKRFDKKINNSEINEIDKTQIQSIKKVSHSTVGAKNVFSTNMSLGATKEVSEKINLAQSSKSKPLIEKELIVKEEDDDEVKLFDANEKFDSIIRPFVDEANSKNIELSYYVDPDIPKACFGNIYKIKEVFINLINHSLGFTQAYGTIKIRVDNVAQMKSENAIRFSITDSGSHISKEQKKNIMKVFKTKEINQLKTVIDPQSSLIFVSNLIFLLDGTFEIVSEPQKGSTLLFVLTLKKA